MVVIVDAGLGNIASVQNMVRHVGGTSDIRTSPKGVPVGVPLVLPGVGSYDEGVTRLRSTGWFEYLRDIPPTSPLLGICLGMQLLGRSSAEGTLAGLGRIEADFERFPDSGLAVPHMGWNVVRPVLRRDPLFDDSLGELRYYFTHSYYAVCNDASAVLATTNYGLAFPAAYRNEATYGVQFHPEKSHKFGMSLFRRWLEAVC